MFRRQRDFKYSNMAVKALSYLRNTLCPEGMTPLPVKEMSILFIIMVNNGMTSTACFSYLPKMVNSFGISEVDTGHYVGLLQTSYFIGYIVFGLLWGYLGDVKGDKLTMMLSITAMSITTLAFGYSTSFWWAFVTRLLQGSSSGFVVLCKSMLAKSLDETNMSLGFSILFTSWTFSIVIGPSTAGYLVFPAKQYPKTFPKNSLFGRFGILLPNLVFVVLNICIAVATIIFMPEDEIWEMSGSQGGKPLLSDSNFQTRMEELQKVPIMSTEKEMVKAGRSKRKYSDNILKRFFSKMPPGVYKITQLFQLKDFVLALLAFFFFGFAVLGVESMFPVFAATSEHYHGLAMSTSKIGTVLLVSGIGLLVTQVFATAAMCKRFGEINTFIFFAMLLVFAGPMTPVVAAIPSATGQEVAAVAVNLVTQVSVNGIGIALNILLNNAVTKDVYGSANGIAFTMNSLGRVIAPSVFGTLFTWSLKNVKNVSVNEHPLGFPFNQFFVFFLASLSFLVCALIVASFSPELNTRNGID